MPPRTSIHALQLLEIGCKQRCVENFNVYLRMQDKAEGVEAVGRETPAAGRLCDCDLLLDVCASAYNARARLLDGGSHRDGSWAGGAICDWQREQRQREDKCRASADSKRQGIEGSPALLAHARWAMAASPWPRTHRCMVKGWTLQGRRRWRPQHGSRQSPIDNFLPLRCYSNLNPKTEEKVQIACGGTIKFVGGA